MPNPISLTQIGINGEPWNFPKELTLLERTLNLLEQYSLSKWWEIIKESDRTAVVDFLNQSYTHLQSEILLVKKLTDDWYPYAAMFAIGSTVRGVENYHD